MVARNDNEATRYRQVSINDVKEEAIFVYAVTMNRR